MQNFKSFLKEEITNDISFYLTIPGVNLFMDENVIADEVEKILTENFKRLQIHKLDLIACWHPELHIKVIVPDNIDFNHLANEIYLIVREVTVADKPICDIILYELPEDNKVIEWNSIIINLHDSPKVSFHNIHKKLKCNLLTISFATGKITDSVLGLLYIKHLHFQSTNAEWKQIILKHSEGDKDILECQEELITNGLRQYAKL